MLAAGIRTVVDVRALPLSRKRGFSKTAFAAALARVGIAYSHMPALGCPKAVRDRYQADRDWATYTRAFLAYLDTQPAATLELVELSRTSTACLVCFEADSDRCHRTYVARDARRRGGLPILHLTATTVLPDRGFPEMKLPGFAR